ncbi:MAG: hypothetical protein ACE5JJ_02065 [Nitrospinota bacterium]
MRVRCECGFADCHIEVELTPEDAELYLPRGGQENLIYARTCRHPTMTSVIRYGPDYMVVKGERILRPGMRMFHSSRDELPRHK